MVGQAQRILVVDDDDLIRELVCDILEAEGYETRPAANGREALQLLRDWEADLIVLDLMMPEIDGWTFRSIQRTLEDIAEIPVVLLSASHQARAETARLQAAALLAKPFDIGVLVTTVREALSQSITRRAA